MEHIHGFAVFIWPFFQLFFYGLCFEVTNYFGCFNEGVDDKTEYLMKHEEMTPERCTNYCYYNDVTYSVLTGGNDCRCTETLAQRQVDDKNCEEQCLGDAGSYCGGKTHHTYLTSCPRERWGPRCMLPCHCFAGVQCPLLSGLCPEKRCVLGWIGRYCDFKIPLPIVSPDEVKEPKYDMAPCSMGHFGKGCVYECHCQDGLCHVYNGMCMASTRCQSGWHGRRCDFRDGCASNPCRNNGKCKDYGKEFECDCPSQFSGRTCAFINPCLSNPCKNGGTCVLYGNLYDCSCTADYYGILCDKYSPDSDSSSDEIEYLGCYRFLREEQYLLHKRLWWGSNKRISIRKCVRHCKERLYTYAGLQFGSACWCGEAYFTYGAVGEVNCNNTCNKDGAPRCGGKMVNSVYTVCPMGRYKLDCQSKCHCSGRQCNLMTGSCEGQPCIGGWTGVQCDQAEAKPLRGSLVLAIFLLAYTALVIVLAFYDVSTQSTPLQESRELRQKQLEDQSVEMEYLSVGHKASSQAIAGTIRSTPQIRNVGSTKGSVTKVGSKTAKSTSQIRKVRGLDGSATKVATTPPTTTSKVSSGIRSDSPAKGSKHRSRDGSETKVATTLPTTTPQDSPGVDSDNPATETKQNITTPQLPATANETSVKEKGPKKKSGLLKLLKQVQAMGKKKKKKSSATYGTHLQVPGAERRKRRKKKMNTDSPKDIIFKVPSWTPQPTK